MAYEQAFGPLGDARHDHLTAMIVHTLANLFRGQGPAYPIEQFLPAWAPRPAADGGGPDGDLVDEHGSPVEPWQALKAKVAITNQLLGGRDLRPDVQPA